MKVLYTLHYSIATRREESRASHRLAWPDLNNARGELFLFPEQRVHVVVADGQPAQPLQAQHAARQVAQLVARDIQLLEASASNEEWIITWNYYVELQTEYCTVLAHYVLVSYEVASV